MIERLMQIDLFLRRLALSDSSIKEKWHIRGSFNEVIRSFNELKKELGREELVKSTSWYFDENKE